VHTPEYDLEKSSRASTFQIGIFKLLLGLFIIRVNTLGCVAKMKQPVELHPSEVKQNRSEYFFCGEYKRLLTSQKQKGIEENTYLDLDIENAFVFGHVTFVFQF
jgi:hypothetical protein